MRAGYYFILLILACIPYVPGLFRGFVYDDHGSIEENFFLSDADSLRRLLTFDTISDPKVPDGRRPTVILSYMIDRNFWKLNSFGYHVTNLFLHAANIVLVILLCQRLKPNNDQPFLSWACGFLFGLHPVLTEAIQVPAFREDLLSTLFILAFLLAASGRNNWMGLAPPFLLLALGSKESAIIAPLLLAGVWLLFPSTRPIYKTGVVVMAISLAMSGVFAATWFRIGALQAAAPEMQGVALDYPTNLLTAPWLWLKAVKLMFWPHPLIADYVIKPLTGMGDVRFVAGLLVLILWTVLTFLAWKREPLIALGMGWMLIAYLPVANLLPLYNPFAERYLYLIAVGFCFLPARALCLLPVKTFRCAGSAESCLHLRALGLAVIAAIYMGMGGFRVKDWRDDFTLWSTTIGQMPNSARAHTWLGLLEKRNGQMEHALKHFQEADKLNPADLSALINIAVLYGQMERYAEAESLLREAIRRRPNKPDAYWNLGMALLSQGLHEEAETAFQKTVEIDPWYPPARALINQQQADQYHSAKLAPGTPEPGDMLPAGRFPYEAAHSN